MTFLECKDKNPYCENWAVNHQCIENPSFMSLNCQKACGLCTGSVYNYSFPRSLYKIVIISV